MPDETSQQIPLKRASRIFNVSRSTLERRREKARDKNDEATYASFILRTKSGETLHRPTKDRVEKLIKEGQIPEWFVERSWLEKQYGRRRKAGEKDNSARPSRKVGNSPGVSLSADLLPRLREEMEQRHAKVIEQYEKQIEDLKADKQALRQEKREALASAQQDKQMFADAVRRLTQFLSQPAIAEAVQAQLDAPPTKSQPHSVDGAKQAAPSNAAGESTAGRRWWSRFRKSN